jgi:hypothetical protein
MQRFVWTALLVIIAGVGAAQDHTTGAADTKHDEEHTQWIQQVVNSISSIQVGNSRRSLSGLFEEDGGMQFREHGRYVYKQCPFIKIDIEFFAADRGDRESPNDKIVKVSRPYLEYPSAD